LELGGNPALINYLPNFRVTISRFGILKTSSMLLGKYAMTILST
jgi:hypothetical protein